MTRQRAEQHGLIEMPSLAELTETCGLIISVCPPHAAEEVARSVLDNSFQGVYLDANAISPQRVVRIGEMFQGTRASFVDGGIIGPPAWKAGTTWLYLAGRDAKKVAGCFHAGPLGTEAIGETVGKASALKMCYAAYTKGTTALLAAIQGAAEGLGVREELNRQWSRDGSDFPEQAKKKVRQSTGKAWRFIGEMEEISSTFREAGMPGGFHGAAADIYRLLAHFKNAPEPPPIEEVLAALLGKEGAKRA